MISFVVISDRGPLTGSLCFLLLGARATYPEGIKVFNETNK
jgi:hypothetical protein